MFERIRRPLLLGVVFAAGILFALGITLHVMVLPKHYLWSATYSVVGIITALYAGKQYFLSVVIATLAVAIPVVKFYLLTCLTALPREALAARSTFFHGVEWLASWSMFDVLLLSIVIFLLKKEDVYDPTLMPGIYCFAGSVILSLVAQHAVSIPHSGVNESRRTLRRAAYAVLVLCTAAASALLVLGVTQPIVHFTALWYFHQEYSVVSLTTTLYQQGHTLLFLVLLVFSIIFPVAKILFLIVCSSFTHYLVGQTKLVRVIEWFGRYSMVDIMVLALMIFYMNGGGYTESTVLAGAYLFTASIVVTMLGYAAAHVLLQSRRVPKEGEGK